MTDNEILKALKCCKVCSAMEECNECPYVECSTKKGCVGELIADALDLINRQKAEIERFKKDLNTDFVFLGRTGKTQMSSQLIRVRVNAITAEAFRDFVYAFKMKFAKERYRDNYVIDDEMLDNLLKEMTEQLFLDKKFGGDTE